MTVQQRIDQYKNGLITWAELQSALAKEGYQLKDGFNTGRYHLLPLRGIEQ